MSDKAKRRWYQFSLRSALLTVTLVSIPLGWLAYQRSEVKRRGAAIAAIEKRGGRIEFDAAQPFRPHWLQPLLGDRSPGEVVQVVFWKGNVTDVDLELIAGMTKLKQLDLHGSDVTDAGLPRLAGLTKLKRLYLHDTRVTDDGLAHLAALKELEHLDISQTKTTDAGLAHLDGLSELQGLSLYDNRVTDEGLAHLVGHKKLKWLYLLGTQVTDEGIKELKKSLPDARIRQ